MFVDKKSKDVLNCVLIQSANGNLSAIATDKYRVIWRYAQAEEVSGDFQVVVPAKALESLAGFMGTPSARRKSKEPISVTINGTELTVSSGPQSLTVEASRAEYPAVQRVVAETSFSRELRFPQFAANAKLLGSLGVPWESGNVTLFGTDSPNTFGFSADEREIGVVCMVTNRNDKLISEFDSLFVSDESE